MSSVREASFWYLQPQGQKHKQVFSHFQAVEEDQQHIKRQNLAHAHLYSNRYEPGLDISRGAFRSGYAAITENVIQSVVDTATSLIGKSRPKATVLTDGAEWSVQMLARSLDKFLWGMFQSLGVHDKMGLIFRDACIFGTGVLRLCIYRGKLLAERVLIDDILVDERTCPNGGGLPRQLAQTRYVSREKLKELFPEKAEQIDGADLGWRRSGESHFTEPDMVLVVEAWHLRPRGRYVMAISTCTLVDEEYDKEHFPHMFYTWSPPLTGFYGQGLAEGLIGYQIRLNELNDFIRECQDKIAVPRYTAHHSSKLFPPEINNEIGAAIYWTEHEPRFVTPQAVGPEIYQYKEQIKAAAFEFAGISKMAAQATRPEGIEAAVALRELSDNQSQRFSIQQQRFEDAHLEVAKRIAELSRELVESGEAPAQWMDQRLVKEIDWSQVDFCANRFVLQVQASSILGLTPAGRLQRVTELMQYGVPVHPQTMRRLLAHPDLELEDRRATSALEDIEWTIDMLLKGVYYPPEPYQDLNLGLERVSAAYLDARRGGCDEELLDLFRQWLAQAQELIKAAAPPTPPAPLGPGLPGAPMDPSMMGAQAPMVDPSMMMGPGQMQPQAMPI